MVASLFGLIVTLEFVAGTVVARLWGMPAAWVIAAALFLLLIPVLLLDAVTLA
jgi:hypothetical protein